MSGEKSKLDWLSIDQQLREVAPIAGWAPGDYLTTCGACARKFTGAKLSSQCFACAYKAASAGLRDRLDGASIELGSALGVLWRHGNSEARTWVFLNFPGWARTAAISSEFSSDPYVKFDRPKPPEDGGASP